MARRKPQAELKPIYVRPNLDRWMRAALRDYRRAAFTGKPPGANTVDPLWMRMGMQAHQIESRAGWVVSNPIYNEMLVRRPDQDPSLPGPEWLRQVYRRALALCLLPRARAVVAGRLQAAVARETFKMAATPPPMLEPQQELFP